MQLIGKGKVLGIDIDIRAHNRSEIEKHPMKKRIEMIEGSSLDPSVVQLVKKYAKGKKKIMVCLDSNHTHTHVLRELELYANFTSVGSYCVVFDTVIEDLPKGMYDRNWDKGDNPKTAVFEFLKRSEERRVGKEC